MRCGGGGRVGFPPRRDAGNHLQPPPPHRLELSGIKACSEQESKSWPNQNPNDRVSVAVSPKGEDFQVQHLAETTDLSPNQARELLRRHGDDWRKIDEAAKVFKAES